MNNTLLLDIIMFFFFRYCYTFTSLDNCIPIFPFFFFITTHFFIFLIKSSSMTDNVLIDDLFIMYFRRQGCKLWQQEFLTKVYLCGTACFESNTVCSLLLFYCNWI
jgi:hypothetical protein